MADIQFDEESGYQAVPRSEEESTLVRLMLKTGVVSTGTQAKYVVLGIVVLLVVVAFLIPSLLGGSQERVPQSVMDAALQLPPSSYPQ